MPHNSRASDPHALTDSPLDLLAVSLTIVLCAIWGGAFVAIKVGTMDMPPLGAGALRFLLTSLVLTGWAYYRRVPLRFGRTEAMLLLILGVLFFYTNVAAYVGTSRTTSGRLRSSSTPSRFFWPCWRRISCPVIDSACASCPAWGWPLAV